MRWNKLPGAILLAVLACGAGAATATAAPAAAAPSATGTFESVLFPTGMLTARGTGVAIERLAADPVAAGQVWTVAGADVNARTIATPDGRCLASTASGINPLGDEEVRIERCAKGSALQQWALRTDSRGTALVNVGNNHVATVTEARIVIARVDQGQPAQRFTALLHND